MRRKLEHPARIGDALLFPSEHTYVLGEVTEVDTRGRATVVRISPPLGGSIEYRIKSHVGTYKVSADQLTLDVPAIVKVAPVWEDVITARDWLHSRYAKGAN